ncbi:hypothetical protein [Encephalitozoon cuniculi GB-M1]|uniref:M7GpppX diphosphatase n=2 Tax=Encephalitozoon cuniculi TaxID=6035 RepID=Q8SUA2_ENCCU|nr:uncharacterized protein ECU10_1710 [Encephalitozoon cuniculi GB-M1]AGE96584.1 hypothetical protein ECU10_1710 [Encephalitozoon cuniculi]KMV65325.1 hypothetical protein M970_101660 [Encephalitozoon cuniculi EcunIII-L]UYI26637.1 m7GpppX diphosphatase [Encephalitozoon cuniculi]CAD25892.1 hypothetical protein [Encephalitozoon cuniculi GB-M1]
MENIIKEFALEECTTCPEGNLYIGRIRGKKALLIFPKQLVLPDTFSQVLSLPKENTQSNDIYYSFKASVPMNIDFRLIYPATEEHVRKYCSKRIYVEETYEEYLDFIKSASQITSNWMDNLIAQDRSDLNEEIMYEDEEVIMIPDYKWNPQTVDLLHFLVVFKDPGLKTIRDIRDYQILVDAREKARNLLETRFGLDFNHVFMFFHYRPTYFRLHLHVMNIKMAHEGNVSCTRAIPLHDVIHNLRIDINYYKKSMFVMSNEVN